MADRLATHFVIRRRMVTRKAPRRKSMTVPLSQIAFIVGIATIAPSALAVDPVPETLVPLLH